MNPTPAKADIFALVRPALDAHTLGVAAVHQLLADCGYRTVIADRAACEWFGDPANPAHAAAIDGWLRQQRITFLGFSYRLDPQQGAVLCGQLVARLRERRLLADQGGPLKGLFFAGLPETCRRVREQHPEIGGTFPGDETPAETLAVLGIPATAMPAELTRGLAYDEARLAFGRDMIARDDYRGVRPFDRRGYDRFGLRGDSVVARIAHAGQHGRLPLFRAHVGPFLPDRRAAVEQFLQWTRQLAQSGFLDVLSVGSSQLTQSAFGEDWGDRSNGGGVPLNSPAEFAAVWHAARPMLVRTYAGTKNIPALARMHEATLDIAWHALSLWWFCRLDGRGPYSLRENLEQHVETIRYSAATGKPFEANVSHHFAFRGADDVTYVVAGVLAARTAKTLGVRHFILQNMLNTPKSTWGVQDLAKSRVMLQLVRELEDDRFRVILQPRAGLDYFSPDEQKAKAQLAAATALMDDIEPFDSASPPLIHVVSYCEAVRLANPAAVVESIQITRQALRLYRRLRARGLVDDMRVHPEVTARTRELLADTRAVLRAIDATIPNPCTADGLYTIFARGFLPVPDLWEDRAEFPHATCWRTRPIRGASRLVDSSGRPLTIVERIRRPTPDGLRRRVKIS